MDFKTFREKYRKYPLVKSSYFALEDNSSYLRRLVSEWCKKGWLLQLRRGMYLITEEYSRDQIEPYYIANQLYEPSYVSLESALSFYDLIPEGVPQITSVTTRKTAQFTNSITTFRYASIKTMLFWGYRSVTVGSRNALIASPEKALLDLVYLRKGELTSIEELIESLRLQNTERIQREKLIAASKRFSHPKVGRVAEELAKLLQGRRKQ